MSTIFDQNLLPEFDSVKDDDEQILWIGKPKFIPYITGALGFGIVAIVFVFIFFAMTSQMTAHMPMETGPFRNFSWIFPLFPLIAFALQLLRRLLSYSNTSYAYTNKRIMIRTGFIGTDFKSIDYDKISDMQVTVNVVERAFNVGTIRFFSGRTQVKDRNTTQLYDRWEAIPDPYEVFKKVKKVSVDIKTDYNYPNALRPENNPGYNTRYGGR